MITDMILGIEGSLPGLASFSCTNSLGRLSNRGSSFDFRPSSPFAAPKKTDTAQKSGQRLSSFSFPLDKSYYMGLYFLYFNRHNIRKFVNILPVIFGR